MFHRKITTLIHRVAARHEFPFRLSNRQKRTGFQTSHPSAWHEETRDTWMRRNIHTSRERASKMRRIHSAFVWKASRGGTRGLGTHPPKKWHKGAPSLRSSNDATYSILHSTGTVHSLPRASVRWSRLQVGLVTLL